MDILMLVAPRATSVGYEGQGDFSREASGRLRRRQNGEIVPFVYAGVAIVKPEMVQDTPEGPFSANLFYDRAIARGRLYRSRTRRPMASCGRAARHRRGGSVPCCRRAMSTGRRACLFHPAGQPVPADPGRRAVRRPARRTAVGRSGGACRHHHLCADPPRHPGADRAAGRTRRREGAAPAAHRAARRSGRGRVRTDRARGHAARGSRSAQAADSAAGAPADPDAADPALVGAGRPHAAAARARRAVSRARIARRRGQSRGRSRNADGFLHHRGNRLARAGTRRRCGFLRVFPHHTQLRADRQRILAADSRRSGRRAIRRRGAAR